MDQTLDNPPTPDQVTLDTTTSLLPPDDVAKTRAYKAQYGLDGVVQKGYDEIYQAISQGHEDAIRQEAATKMDIANATAHSKQVMDLAAQRGSQLSLDEVQSLSQPKPVDPKSVIEQGYATNYVNNIDTAAKNVQDTVLDDAKAQDPHAVAAYMAQGTDLLTKREYALKQAEEQSQAASQQSYFGFTDPFFGERHEFSSMDLKELATLGFYSSLNLRGNTDQTSRLGFLGNVLDEEAKELLNKPFDEFKDKFDGIMKVLSNKQPELAAQFAQAVSGMSTSDKYMYNANETLNVAMAVEGARGLTGAFKLGEGRVGASATGGSPTPPINGGTLTQGSDAVYRAQRAITDAVQSANVPTVSKASIAEGAGDVQEAAVQKAVNSTLNPDPEKDAIDTLFKGLRSHTDSLEQNPGPDLSREAHTRLIDAAKSYEKDLADTIKEVTRVVRTPLAAEAGFRDIAERIKDYFPGRENTIANVDMRYDEISNTYHHDIRIVNYDGNPFSSVELATRHAEINGYEPAIVGLDPEKLYLPAAAIKNLESVKETPEGTRFYVDNGIEVESTPRPIPGHVPFNLKTKKFEAPLNAITSVIEQQGLGFHIRVSIPLNETEPFIRDGLIGSEKARSSSNINTGKLSSIGNAVLGYLRSPDDTLSQIDVENRGKVVYSRSKYLELAHSQMQEVEKVYRGLTHTDENGQPLSAILHHPVAVAGVLTGKNNQVWNEFRRTLVALQKMPDPDTGLPGRYFTNPNDIHDFYMRTWRRPPTYQENAALLATARLDHFDHILRNVAVYRNKARLGVEQHTLYSVVDGKRAPISTFEARRIKDVRVLSTEDPILIHDADGSERYFNSMGTDRQKEFREAVAEGRYHGVEIYDMEQFPIKRQDVQGNPLMIRYVFSNSMDSKPMTYAQVGYRGGGHWEYNYEHAVKQATIHTQWVGGKQQNIYKGDATFGFMKNRAMGEDFAKHMNVIRELIAERKFKDAKTYAASKMDIEWKDLRKSFQPMKNPKTGELQPARFSLKEPFQVVPRGLTIRELSDELENRYTYVNANGSKRETFIDGTKRGLARNFQVEYTGARDSYDLFAPTNTGTVDAPFYKFEPAELTDPIVTMGRAVNRIVESSSKDDYQIMAAEHWLQENKDLLKAKESEIRSAPFRHFNDASNRSAYRRGADQLRVNNAISNAYKIKQLIGTPSTLDTLLHSIKQEMSDSLYRSGRDLALTKIDKKLPKTLAKVVKAPLVAPEWLLDHINHPVDFGRAMAYHSYLGLFNWVQVVTQNVSYLTIAALSPTHAIQGTFAALMHQWSRLTAKEANLDYLDRMATNFGWKLGEWKEGMRLLEKTGFGVTGNTLAIGNSAAKNEAYFTSWPKKFLDKSQVFFHEADKNVRFGAWYTAFHEFKAANPFLKIGPVEEGQILRRARDLNTNMDRSSNTILNKGVFGMTFQFFHYLKNVGDLFLGKRIGDTVGQRNLTRLRMYIIFSLAFGPIGATGLTGLPLGDQIRKEAIREGYVPGANIGSTLAMEGPLSVIGAFITGKGDIQAGTFYNFNNRFGANGLQIIRDVMQTDPNFWKIVTGAAGSSIGNTFANLSGFTHAMSTMLSGDYSKEAWPLKEQDWLDGAKSIASARYAERLMFALSYGKWIDSHGRPTQDINAGEAIFRTLFGVQDVNIDDQFLKAQIKKEETDLFNQGTQEYLAQRRLAEQAAANNDPQGADDYNKRAFFALTNKGIPLEMWPKIMAQDATINKDTIEKNDESYYRNHVPTYRQDAAREADRQIQLMKAKQ